MTPQTFITKWGPGGPAFHLNEEQGAQSHFIDLCDLLGVPRPGTEAGYLFEEKNTVIGGRTGYADVFRRGAFAWENKAPGKNLDAALTQLLRYSSALSNPPILVVCDRLTIRIQTQFTGHPTETFSLALAEFDQPDKLALLRRIWTDPESFRPKKTSRDITEAAARSFATLADGLRKRGPAKDTQPQQAQQHADEVAHFLTQCLFCFFAEDVGLLPGRMFEGLVNNRKLTSDKLTTGLHNLFTVMREGGLYGNDDIPWFNGGLFRKIKVPALTVLDMTELRNAAALNWSAIDVSIFGTLFERGLDPAKRSQLGAHYTDPATIMRIVEPVLQRPLLQIWEQTALVIKGLLAKSKKKGDASYMAALAQFVSWLDQLENYRVLDPACGSGNFLFLGLKALKDIEHKSHLEAATLGLDREADLVTGPHNMLGIELNEYAAELARVTVWIGELQWRLQHGYEFKTNPVLDPLDHIECRDALLRFDAEGMAREATWPRAGVVIGNPPFLGQRFQVRELGEAYVKSLRTVYADKVTGNVDLVCYWFVKALTALTSSGLGAAGLVATNSIRGGDNRDVLTPIAEKFHIFNAWSDGPWVNEGAAVRVSLISFGNAVAQIELNGQPVGRINADLSASRVGEINLDLTTALALAESQKAAFAGFQMNGSFNVSRERAAGWLALPNPNGMSSALVLHPYANASDITKRSRDEWLVDFTGFSEDEAALFEAPFKHVQMLVRPERAKKREPYLFEKYWLHKRSSPDMRKAIKPLKRFIATPMVSKYRLFAWLPTIRIPENAAIVIARADDATFGILHSRFHELWSLRMGTFMGVGNDPRYTPTTCFETFPFPEGLTPADTAHQQTEAITGGALIPAGLSAFPVRAELVEALPSVRNPSTLRQAQDRPGSGRTDGGVRGAAEAIARAAKRLNDLREAWLNPPEWTLRAPEVIPLGLTVSPYPDRIIPKDGHEKELAERTLTKLYNRRPAWLDAAHKELDTAVASAYGWADYLPDMPDEEILKRLLALNLERSAAGHGTSVG
jgi:hypothetical protein